MGIESCPANIKDCPLVLGLGQRIKELEEALEQIIRKPSMDAHPLRNIAKKVLNKLNKEVRL